MKTQSRGSLRKLSKGGNWRNLDLRKGVGGIKVKDETKFHKHHLGGLAMCECVFACRVSYRILSFGRECSPKFCRCGGVYSTNN